MSSYMIIGLPGHGKSFLTARLFKKLLRRNLAWFKKSKQKRLIYSNLIPSEKWQKEHEYANSFIRYWSDPQELVELEDVDIIWDEIARHIDSRAWQTLNPKLKAFIQETDKRGIELYANSQSPMQVDVMFRRNCEQIWRVTKLIGSRRPSATRPPVRVIWGILWVRRLKRVAYGKEEDEEEFEAEIFQFPVFRWIGRNIVDFFVTRQKISVYYPPFEHIERSCRELTCNHSKIIHA